MLVESARVVALEGAQVRVETVRHNACSSCRSRSGCGQRLLAEIGQGKSLQLLVSNPEQLSLQPGDQVELGIEEARFLAASFTVYLLPLLLLIVAAGWVSLAGGSEFQVIAAAVSGLVAGFGWLAYKSRHVKHQCHYRPRIIGRI
jgi:sigma-E factor negative regulatory protein RseC